VNPSPAFPVLDVEDRHLYQQGLEQFNAGLFFECHDSLEEVWSGVRGPSRDFFQGLIQVAVGFYHLSNANQRGAVTLLGRGLQRLGRYGAAFGGLDLDRLRREVADWLSRVEGGEGFPDALEALPKLHAADEPA
jgi:predicted metal-dependent hydrolase